MAKVFGVSRSGFYYWIDNRNKVTERNEHRKQLDIKVREVFDDKKERDGARRIQKELEENGNKRDVKTIAARNLSLANEEMPCLRFLEQ